MCAREAKGEEVRALHPVLTPAVLHLFRIVRFLKLCVTEPDLAGPEVSDEHILERYEGCEKNNTRAAALLGMERLRSAGRFEQLGVD